MKPILFIILLSFGCNNSDDLFFVLNPNKKTVLDKEKRECIRDTFAFAIAGLNNKKQFIDGSKRFNGVINYEKKVKCNND